MSGRCVGCNQDCVYHLTSTTLVVSVSAIAVANCCCCCNGYSYCCCCCCDSAKMFLRQHITSAKHPTVHYVLCKTSLIIYMQLKPRNTFCSAISPRTYRPPLCGCGFAILNLKIELNLLQLQMYLAFCESRHFHQHFQCNRSSQAWYIFMWWQWC